MTFLKFTLPDGRVLNIRVTDISAVDLDTTGLALVYLSSGDYFQVPSTAVGFDKLLNYLKTA